MRANQRARHAWLRDDGVSSVIGAILVTALALTLLLTIRVSFVPVWEKNAQETHLLGVERQLAAIKADLDRQVDNRSATTLTNALTLTPERVSIFQGTPAVHRVGFETVGREAKFSSTALLLLVQNGVSISGLNPDWEPAVDTLVDVESIEALRVRFNVTHAKAGESARLQVTDGDGNAAGHLLIRVLDQPPDIVVLAESFEPGQSTPLSAFTETFHISSTTPGYFLDAMDDSLLFDQILAAAASPFTLTLTQTPNLDADYTVAYNQATGSGTVLVGTTGVLRPNYNVTHNGGSLVYRATGGETTDRTYYLENGAVILSQPDGAVFRIPPAFSVLRTGAVTSLSLAIPSLSGSGASIAGAANVKVTTTAIVGSEIRAVAPDYQIRVNSSFPQLWHDFFEEKMLAAQLTPTTHFTLTQDATSTTLRLLGTDSDPTKNDISIRSKQATIVVALEG